MESSRDVSDEKTERGASMVEYAIIGTLIAVICVSAVTFLGRELSDSFSRVGSSFGN